jgi:hypothetical protein
MLTMASLTVVDKQDKSVSNQQEVFAHFNPESLRVSYSFTGPRGAQSRSSQSATGTTTSGSHQRTDYRISLSSLQLFFDTTQTGEDVRNTTLKIAAMLLVAGGNASPRVRFQWGQFLFFGTIQSMQETLDYFSPQGLALRATVDLTLDMVDSRRRSAGSVGVGFSLGFSAGASAGLSAGASASANISAGVNAELSGSVSAGVAAGLSAGAAVGTMPLTLAASGESIQSMAARAGVDWKTVAAANNIDNPRQLQGGAVVNLNAGLK